MKHCHAIACSVHQKNTCITTYDKQIYADQGILSQALDKFKYSTFF